MTTGPRIAGVEAIPLVVAGPRDFRISEGGTRTHVSVVLRVLTDVDGLEGIAEAVSAPPGKPEEFLEEIVGAVRRYVAPAVTGLPATERIAAMRRVEAVLKGRIWTKAALNNALWDLQGKALGVPVSDLLGGRLTDRIPVIGPVLSMAAPDEMAARARALVEAGFTTLKLKVGETPERDLARVRAVREAVGAAAALRVDANDHYRPADAVRFIRAIEPYEPEHVEQPLPRHDLLGMAEVRRKVGVPLMTDDAVATPQDAAAVIRLGAADRVKVKATKHGLDGARLLVGMLEAAGIGCVLGHVFEMGLAAAAEAQLALTAPNLCPPHEIGSLQPMGVTADIVTADLQPRRGEIRPPIGPGLGVALDWARIEEWRAR
ncbi:MAG TPA: enolase C-terminal domain-like protein [Thermodesulfobacteriota bacterium]